MDNDWLAWMERCKAAEATIARMWEGHAAQTGHMTAEDCVAAECEVRAAVDCPHGEELHYHHDGCPSCEMDDGDDGEDLFDLPLPGPDCSDTEHVAGCRHYSEQADYSKVGTVVLPEPRSGTFVSKEAAQKAAEESTK